jgi:hypothetical protein
MVFNQLKTWFFLRKTLAKAKVRRANADLLRQQKLQARWLANEVDLLR